MDQFSCRDQGTFGEQLRRQPRLDDRIRVSRERCQLKLQAWESHCREDSERGGRRRPQEPALPGIMTRRGLERERRQAHLYRAGRRPSTRGPHVLGILTRQPAVTLEQFQGLAGGSQLMG